MLFIDIFCNVRVYLLIMALLLTDIHVHCREQTCPRTLARMISHVLPDDALHRHLNTNKYPTISNDIDIDIDIDIAIDVDIDTYLYIESIIRKKMRNHPHQRPWTSLFSGDPYWTQPCVEDNMHVCIQGYIRLAILTGPSHVYLALLQ